MSSSLATSCSTIFHLVPHPQMKPLWIWLWLTWCLQPEVGCRGGWHRVRLSLMGSGFGSLKQDVQKVTFSVPSFRSDLTRNLLFLLVPNRSSKIEFIALKVNLWSWCLAPLPSVESAQMPAKIHKDVRTLEILLVVLCEEKCPKKHTKKLWISQMVKKKPSSTSKDHTFWTHSEDAKWNLVYLNQKAANEEKKVWFGGNKICVNV